MLEHIIQSKYCAYIFGAYGISLLAVLAFGFWITRQHSKQMKEINHDIQNANPPS